MFRATKPHSFSRSLARSAPETRQKDPVVLNQAVHIRINTNMTTGDTFTGLCKATDYDEGDTGSLTWVVNSHQEKLVEVSSKGTCVTWKKSSSSGPRPCWVPLMTRAYLHSGTYSWHFNISEMGGSQIGVGFGLLYGGHRLDWGFFGYLGASASAVAYDPSTGDVVTATKSVQGGLPIFKDKNSGTVSVYATLPRKKSPGSAKFIVNGVESKPVALPEGAVICPAACLLREGQSITLANYREHR